MLAIPFVLLLPETANEELPQTIEEAKNFGNHQTYIHCIMCQRPSEDPSKSSIQSIDMI
jgi:hypothetical protein